MKRNVLWITQTGIFIALLIVVQFATASLGNTIITGSAVNLILIVSVMTYGLSSALSVGIVSPIFAKLLGIGPLWELIPFIILGNIVLINVWYFICKIRPDKPIVIYIISAVSAAVAKFLTLYLGIVVIAVPILLKLPEKQAAVISNMFSIPQLITALIGGGIAVAILPVLKKATSHPKS